jgi:glyoxylase-like metal-dependent hydrolase (beta-lactamase superfamily II)
MASQIPVPSEAVAGTAGPEGLVELTSSLAYLRRVFVNVAFIGDREDWILVDAAIPGSRDKIVAAARSRFGATPPRAIVLTHGHFDHVGSLERLLALWDVPVYAHPLEHPFLNGSRSYPPPRPRLSDGLMSLSSPLFPRRPINIGLRLRELPADGSVPHLPGWRWIATPGHSPGHVSFWHPVDRLLVAGDAFVTTEQESLLAALSQRAEMHGPPRYFTPDWVAAEDSVEALAALTPEIAVTGHGPALRGEALRTSLERLAREFRQVAVPQ